MITMKRLLKIITAIIGILVLCSFIQPSYPNEGYTNYEAYSIESCVAIPQYNQLGVVGYTEDGVLHDDGSPEYSTGIWRNQQFWDDDYEYYWDEEDQKWQKYDKRLDRWYIWVNVLGWHWTIFDYGKPTHQLEKATKDYSLPLDDGIYALIVIVSVAGLYKVITNLKTNNNGNKKNS